MGAYEFHSTCQPTASNDAVSACVSYTWNGTTYTISGTYVKTGFINAAGCDSVATLVLTINQPTSSSSDTSVCPSALPFTWNGLTFTGAGTKTVHILNAAGCDSAATLTLTVKSNTASVTDLTICPSNLPYSWNGIIFNTGGTQTAHITNAAGCDSAATLNLTVSGASSYSEETITRCSAYTWNGTTYTNLAIIQTLQPINWDVILLPRCIYS